MNITQKLNDIADGFEWKFMRAFDYEANLIDIHSSEIDVPIEQRKVFLILEPYLRKPNFNDHNGVETHNHTSSFVLGVCSDIDRTEKESFEITQMLEPMIEKIENLLIGCGGLRVIDFTPTIVVGKYNLHIDGIQIKFNLRVNNRD